MGLHDGKTIQEPSGAVEPIRFSNGIRLPPREWLVVALFTAALVLFAPSLWQALEPFALEADYRMPHDLSNDYWLYERFARLAAEHGDTLVVGDSVVWGEYVTRQQTLSHYLNALGGKEQYANFGLDGAHPLALSGLIEHYMGQVAGKRVVLQCNPLWLSRAKADLQDDQAEVNHDRLVPQFVPRIPAYKEEISRRLGVLVEQRLPFSKWTNHLQQAYYGTDLPSWTLENPYDNPLAPLAGGLPPSNNDLRHLAQPWFKSGITPQDFPWVELESSLQWHAFQRIVATLQRRENRVFVVVGPFNEHLLTAASRERYQGVKAAIATWLRAHQVAHVVAAPLPSAEYGDASHPLAAGYERLARQLLDNSAFRSAMTGRD